MLRHHPFLLITFMLLLIATNSIAQNVDDAITPLLNQDTLIVMRGDLARIDPNAFLDWLVQQGQGLNAAEIAWLKRWWKPSFDKWGGMLTEARDAGVKRAYCVLTLRSLTEKQGIWAFPIEGQADANKVVGIVRSRKLETRRVGDLVVGAEPGLAIKVGPAEALPPNWAHALEADQDAPIRIAVVPTTALRKSFEENVPALSLSGHQVAITTLTRGIEWLGLSIWLPPKPQIRMVVQSPNAAAAQNLGELVNAALPDMRKEQLSRALLPPPAVLADMLKPTVVGDQVQWQPILQDLLLPSIALEVRMVVRVQSATNIKYLLQGFLMYANNHQGQTPPDLQALIKDQEMSPSELIDPLNPAEKVGFIYIRPTGDWQKHPDLLVLYESTPSGNNIGYADGHVEWWPSHEQVLEQAKAAEARNRGIGANK